MTIAFRSHPRLRLEPLDDRLTPTAGALDLTFGADGKLTTGVGAPSDLATAVALQPDGKMVVAGFADNGTDTDFAVVRYHADGHLDASFSGDGKVTTPVGDGYDDASAVAVQADGKIVVAGRAYVDGSGRIAVVRYNPDGSLDSSFGEGGKVVTAIRDLDGATAAAVQADGRIVVAGFTETGGDYDIALVRYNSDGGLDASFGVGGIVTTLVSGSGGANAVAVQPDGRIVVAGSAGAPADFDFSLVRYLPDGSLDPAFGEGGKARTAFGPTGTDVAQGVAVLPDGRIVAGGYSNAAGTFDFAAARYLPDGTLDPTFNGTGTVLTPVGSDHDSALGVVVQPDGKIALAGDTFDGSLTGPLYNFALVRYNPDGSLDQAFGAGGKVVTSFGGVLNAAHGRAVAAQADGRLVVVGDALTISTTNSNDFALARYNPDGSLDRLADGTGVVTAEFPGSGYGPNALAVQPDGKVVTAGWIPSAAGDFALTRHTPDGALDPTFGGDGQVTTDFGPGADEAYGVVVQPDGRIVAAGFANGRFALARYNPDGSLDPTFDGDGRVTTTIGDPAVYAGATAVALLPDGRIVAVGQANFPGNRDFAVVRYRPDGSLDPTFGGTGVVTLDLGSVNDSASALAVQWDGKILVVGSRVVGGFEDVALARFNPDGTPDGSYGTGGWATTPFGAGHDAAQAVAALADGKILVGGYATWQAGAPQDFLLARFRPDGSPDPTFDGDGAVATDFGGANDTARSLAVLPDGRILLGGTSDYDFALARYGPDGGPDPAFDGDGKVLVGRPDRNDILTGMAVQADGRIVAAGSSGGTGVPLAAILVRLRGDNRAPVPVPTTMGVTAGTPLVVTDPAYFYDPDGDSTTTELLYGPAHGTVSLTPYGTFTYTPDPGFTGADRFAYKVADAFGGFNVGSVTLQVSAAVEVKDDPVLPGKRSLFVRGTSGDDTIVVKPRGTSATAYLVSRNGAPFEAVSGVTGRVYVNGFDGDDSLQVKAVAIPAVLDGGAGNDTVIAGRANDSVTGGLGDDLLDGGPGTDRLIESGDVNFTLIQGTATANGSLTGLGSDVLRRARIERAELTGGAGDNRIDAAAFRGRTWLRGGGGNDTLRGGSSTDLLLGGDGDDDLDGAAGRDLLVGGLGADVLAGAAGSDLLVGGTTAHDGNPDALDAIRAEWTSAATYAARIRHLEGTQSGGRNGNYRLNATTVSDDGSGPDALTGGLGLDWFIVHPPDVTDRADPERVLTV